MNDETKPINRNPALAAREARLKREAATKAVEAEKAAAPIVTAVLKALEPTLSTLSGGAGGDALKKAQAEIKALTSERDALKAERDALQKKLGKDAETPDTPEPPADSEQATPKKKGGKPKKTD